MRRTIIILGAILLLVGCADGRFHQKIFESSSCGTALLPVSVSGYTLTAIHYGDSRLIVVPISKIRPKSEFQFRLIPKRRDKTDPLNYANVVVTITSPDDDGDTPPNWLDVSGSFSGSSGKLTVCVPNSPTRVQYKYDISIANVGDLDPRADVIID